MPAMRNYLSLLFLLAIAISVSGQDAKSAADRVAAQNAIFDDYYESELRNFPERATAFGDYRYNNKLDDYSLDGSCNTIKPTKNFSLALRHSHQRIRDRTCFLTTCSFAFSSNVS